jgi:small Trp-rich protein
MILVWLGVAFVALKLLEFGPFLELSWWWTLAPLAAAVVWFEGLEKLFGLDRRKVQHDEMERRRKERVAAQFPAPWGTAKQNKRP